MPGAGCGADHISSAHVCGAPGGGNVGPAARGVALIARKTWSDPAGVATTMAWTKCRPPRARGVRGWAPRRGRDTLSGSSSSQLAHQAAVAYAAAQAKEAERVAEHVRHVEARWFGRVADAEAAIAEYGGAGPGSAWAPATAVALPCSTLSGRSDQCSPKTDTSRPSAEG